MVDTMRKEFGSLPENLHVAIGPSICRDCYEVGEEVAEAFREAFTDTESIFCEIQDAGIYQRRNVVEPGKCQGKYQLDLWLANAIILRKVGIPVNQIAITDICTCHNPDYLFSHRASNGKRGNLGAFLMLKES